MTEAATQEFFSKSYLAWSFKPIIGFFMDAFGKTKTMLIFLMMTFLRKVFLDWRYRRLS